jgi:hypothetical protein
MASASIYITVDFGGKSTRAISTPLLVKTAKAYYNCKELGGINFMPVDKISNYNGINIFW